MNTPERDVSDFPPAAPPDWQLPPGVSRGLWDYLHDPGAVGGGAGAPSTGTRAGFTLGELFRHLGVACSREGHP